MKFLILLLVISRAHAMNGDKENKVQEEAMILTIDNGKDSPEIDIYLQEKELNEEDLDIVEEER